MSHPFRLVASNPSATPFDVLKKRLPTPKEAAALTPWSMEDIRLHLVKVQQLHKVMPLEAAVVGIVVDRLLRDYYDAAFHRQRAEAKAE